MKKRLLRVVCVLKCGDIIILSHYNINSMQTQRIPAALGASFGKNPRFQIQLDKGPLCPGTSREASGVPWGLRAFTAVVQGSIPGWGTKIL